LRASVWLFHPEVDALGSGFDGEDVMAAVALSFFGVACSAETVIFPATLVVIVTFGNSPLFQDKSNVIRLVKEHIINRFFPLFITPFRLNYFSVPWEVVRGVRDDLIPPEADSIQQLS
jgi:hypothetical protein